MFSFPVELIQCTVSARSSKEQDDLLHCAACQEQASIGHLATMYHLACCTSLLLRICKHQNLVCQALLAIHCSN